MRRNSRTMISEFVYRELTTTRKLNSSGSNFIIWKSKIDFVLFDIGVSYVLTDLKPTDPTEDTPKEERENYQKWISDDFTCRHAILGAMEDNLFIVLDRYKTGKEMMDALINLFDSKNFGIKLALFRKYKNHKMSEETNVMDHVFEMGAMVRELEIAGMAIPEEMQVFILMNSLSDSWKSATDLFMRMGDNELKIDQLMAFLRNEAEMRDYKSIEDDDVEIIESSKKKQKRGGFKGNCYLCGKSGHCKNECPDKVMNH